MKAASVLLSALQSVRGGARSSRGGPACGSSQRPQKEPEASPGRAPCRDREWIGTFREMNTAHSRAPWCVKHKGAQGAWTSGKKWV